MRLVWQDLGLAALHFVAFAFVWNIIKNQGILSYRYIELSLEDESADSKEFTFSVHLDGLPFLPCNPPFSRTIG